MNGKGAVLNPILESPVVKEVIAGSLIMECEDGYFVQPSRRRRKLMYFLVDGTNSTCPLFIEPNRRMEDSTYSKFGEAHAEMRTNVENFFLMLRNSYNLLYTGLRYGSRE